MLAIVCCPSGPPHAYMSVTMGKPPAPESQSRRKTVFEVVIELIGIPD
jgi:hypothetical protein